MTNKEDHKAPLSWNLKDYLDRGEEPPACVLGGVSEGQTFTPEDFEEWAREQIQCLSVIREHYPKRFEELYQDFVSDLDYLFSIGKISKEDQVDYKKMENFNFGQK